MTEGIAETIDVRFSFVTPKDALTLKGWASFNFLACFTGSTDAVQFVAALKELLGYNHPVFLNRKS